MSNSTLDRLLGLASILTVVSLPSIAIAQSEKGNLGTFEDDRIKIVLQECSHKQPDLICQAILTSKNGDRTVELSSETIKLVDFEGNEYYPNNIRVANRSNSQKIQTELVENASFRTSITFAKVPNNLNKFALIQIPLGSNLNTIAKFRNLSIASNTNNSEKETTTTTSKPKPTPSVAAKPAPAKSICPENTKVMYRAATNTRSLFICGNKKPTHYVSTLKENGESTTIELLSYTKNAFIAETGATRYTIYNNRFAISKSERVVLQEKLEVIQPLGKTATTETPTSKPKKNTTPSKPKSTTTNKNR